MVSRSMRTKIVDILYEEQEVLHMKFNEEFLKKCSRDHEGVMDLFARLGIIKNYHSCGNCLNLMQLTAKSANKANKYIWKCRRPCRKEYSIRKDSILETVKAPMEVFFRFLMKWSRSIPQADIAHDLNLNKNTVSKWAMLIREVIQNSLIDNREVLGGYDLEGRSMIVEIDESLFFRRKYNVGRYREAQWIFGLIERNTGKCVLYPVEDRSANTLLPIICTVCRPGTTIISDGWAAYRNISSHGDFTHLTVNHSLNFLNPDNPSVHTQNIENTWLHSKRGLRRQFGCRREHLEGYLYEFIFKKTSKPLIINKLILLLKRDFN